jgi:hypothetical protein
VKTSNLAQVSVVVLVTGQRTSNGHDPVSSFRVLSSSHHILVSYNQFHFPHRSSNLKFTKVISHQNVLFDLSSTLCRPSGLDPAGQCGQSPNASAAAAAIVALIIVVIIIKSKIIFHYNVLKQSEE